MPIDMHVSISLDPDVDDQLALLRQSSRQVLDSEYPPSAVRDAASSELRYSPDFWRKISDLGWPGTLIPGASGGAGGTIIEAGVLAEEMGGALCETPFVSSSVVSAHLLISSALPSSNTILPAVAGGDTIVSFSETGATTRPDSPRVERTAPGYVVDGTAPFVPFAHVSDELLIAGKGPEGEDVLLRADPQDRRISVTLHDTIDWSPLCHLKFDKLELPEVSRLAGGQEASSSIAKALELGAVITCMEQLGGAERCLEMANEYAMNRVQFGRPIATFQAIKHKLADMYASLALARAISYAALRASADGASSPMLTAMACVASSEAFTSVARSALQIYGGLGYTWEVDVHLYLRRAAALATLYGSVPEHLDTIGALLPDLKRKKDTPTAAASAQATQESEV